MITLINYLLISAILFALSLVGLIINRHNLIMLLVCVELLLLSVNTNFIAFSQYFKNPSGEVFVFFILTVAAVEAAIGLAILVLLYRRNNNIDTSTMTVLKG